MHVEHFFPKALYPTSAFSWKNLFSSCRTCNEHKKDHDVLTDPLLHPERYEPADHVTFDSFIPVPKAHSRAAPEVLETVRVCRLDRSELLRARMALAETLNVHQATLVDLLSALGKAQTNAKKSAIKTQITVTLSDIDRLRQPSRHHSLFALDFAQKSPVIQRARAAV